MVNQWGREGQVSSGGGKTGAVLLAALVSLIIGGGAGYGAARYLATRTPAVVAHEDGSLYKLYNETLKQRERASREAADLRLELAAVKAHAAGLEAALSSRNRRSESKAEPDPESDQLRESNHALTIELDAMSEKLAAASAAYEKLAKSRDAINRESGDLKLRLSDLQSRVGSIETSNQDLDLRAKALASELSREKAHSAALKESLDTAEAQIRTLAREVEKAKSPPEPDTSPSETQQIAPENDTETPSAAPRSRLDVENAIARAPRLKSLSSEKRQMLSESLESGACVTVALEKVFKKVPVLTLRSLIRALDSPC